MEEAHGYSVAKGRGYWFWKPALVDYLVRGGEIHEGDLVIYLDGDAKGVFDLQVDKLDLDWEARLAYFNTKTRTDGVDIFVNAQQHCEFSYTKADTFKKFNTTWNDPYYGLTTQAHAQFWISAMNKRTLEFMRKWEELNSDFHLISDEPSKEPNNPYFEGNRHDQSLLSMLIKAQGVHMSDGGMSDNCPIHARLGEMKRDYTDRAPSSAGKKGPKHPVFGIANLNAVIAHFAQFNQDNPYSPMIVQRRADQPVEKPTRNIYVRGKRINLDPPLDILDGRYEYVKLR